MSKKLNVTTVVVPAAGHGTRVLPLSKTVPKELLPINDKPALHHAAEEAHACGITRLVLVISKGKESIAHYFIRDAALERHLGERGQSRELRAIAEPASWFKEVVTVYQDEPRGLGHAVLCAKQAVGDHDFAIVLPDDIMLCNPPCLRQMVDACRQHDAAGAIAILSVPPAETKRYGIVSGPELEPRTMQITKLVEKPKPDAAPSNLAVMGRYLATPELFDCIEEVGAGALGEVQLTDAYQRFAQRRKLLGVRYRGLRLDAGDMRGYLRTQFFLAARDPEMRVMLEEVLKHELPEDNRD